MNNNKNLSTNIKLIFWGILLETFSLGLFEFGPISSEDIMRILGIVLVSIGSYKLIKENINFRNAFIINFIVVIAEIASLVLAFTGFSANLETELTAAFTANTPVAIPLDVLYSGVIDAIVSVVTLISEVLVVIFIVLGMKNINDMFGKPNLTRYGIRRFKGLRNFGIVYIVGTVLISLSSLVVLNDYNKYVDSVITYEELASKYALFGLAGIVVAVGAIGYFVQIVKLLIYMNRTKVAVQYRNIDSNINNNNPNGLRDEDIIDVKVNSKENINDKWDGEIK